VGESYVALSIEVFACSALLGTVISTITRCPDGGDRQDVLNTTHFIAVPRGLQRHNESLYKRCALTVSCSRTTHIIDSSTVEPESRIELLTYSLRVIWHSTLC
jgi:hypothetical protein